LVTVELARTLKFPAVPNGTGEEHVMAAVMNVNVKFIASPLPKRSFAPVVIVAMKVVFSARGAVGVKVAVVPVGSNLTVPGTFTPPVVKVNVVAGDTIVIGFIILLNSTVATALGQMPEGPGSADNTVGGFRAPPGFPAPAVVSASLHPAITTANRNTGIQILLSLNLRIRVSSSIRNEAFPG
jgi:hypothetical protein